ncbi:MAG: hypothetical protein ABF991_03560 [Liquorilactobacillus hordei]|uniref:hypothetical protein n=1 Tax=Liquorilactobacillus hordei TaxID=468911 RepID=UPI0039EBF7A4
MKLVKFSLFTECNEPIIGQIMAEFPAAYSIKPLNYGDQNTMIIFKNSMVNSEIREIDVRKQTSLF